jgi:hypothetical protein
MGKLKRFTHVFTLENHDSYGFPYPSSQIPHTKLPVEFIENGNGTYMMKLPNFNFTTYNLLSKNNYDESLQGMPPGGFLTTYANPLPENLRPKEEQTWSFSANDPYLQNFSYSNPSPPNFVFQGITSLANTITVSDLTAINSIQVGQPINDTADYSIIAPGSTVVSVNYTTGVITLSANAVEVDQMTATFVVGIFPTPQANFNISINPYGILSIFANSVIYGIIPPGPHTLLGKTEIYVPDNTCIESAENFIIDPNFSDVSQFTGVNLYGSIRDTHIHDIFEDIIVFTWVGNSNFVKLGQQSNGVLNTYICVGKIESNGKIKLGPVQQLTDIQPFPTVTFTGNVTLGSNAISNVSNASQLIVGQQVVSPDNVFTNPDFPGYNLITQISGTTVYVASTANVSSTTPITFTAQQAQGFALQIFDTAVSINRTNKNNIVVSYGYANYTNYILGLLGVVNLPVIVPTVQVSNLGGKPGSWSNPINIDSSLIYPNIAAEDCRGIITDKYGNFFYSINSGINLYDDISFYISSDNGYTWKLIWKSTESADATPPGIGDFDFPQIFVGNSGDPSNPYGLFFTSDFGSFDFALVDGIPYFGFVPINGPGFNNLGPVQFSPIPGISNNVQTTSITGKDDGTVFLCYKQCADNVFESNGGGTGVNPHLIFIKPPGPFVTAIQNITGPYTTYQHINNYAKPVNSWPNPGFPYFTLSVQSNWYDNNRKALYFVITNPPSWYDGKTGLVSQDFEIFLIMTFDDGENWSRKFPIASTIKNNRGFPSIMMNDNDKSLYGGFYDSRKSPNSTQIQFFGFKVSAKKLDKWVKIAKKEIGMIC